jgi:hypothetical protein
MRLWIDTEFNEFKGGLISLGLVDESGRIFYEVLHCGNPGPWVAANVIPRLGQAPIPLLELQGRLWRFLGRYDSIHVIADWPEDIKHFCDALILGPGQRIDTPPLTMEVRRDLDSSKSAVPHNALYDALAIRSMALGLP